MPTFEVSKQDLKNIVTASGEHVAVLPKEKIDKFNSSLLGLGDISAKATSVSCVAAVFDLQGFTNFCKQIDPQLSVPLFLKDFLDWLFLQVKSEQIVDEHKEGSELYAPLPFYSKFLGDGILLLWNTDELDQTTINNMVAICGSICWRYAEELYPKLAKKFVEPPAVLECGVARGTVLSVGNGNDYVGSCINMAARLQKLGSTLTFAFNCRGMHLDEILPGTFRRKMMTIKTEIRGIGSGELIAIKEHEFENLPEDEKIQFFVV